MTTYKVSKVYLESVGQNDSLSIGFGELRIGKVCIRQRKFLPLHLDIHFVCIHRSFLDTCCKWRCSFEKIKN